MRLAIYFDWTLNWHVDAVARQALGAANFKQRSAWFRADYASWFTITLAWVIRGMKAITALVKLVGEPTLALLKTVCHFLDNCQFKQPGSFRVLNHEVAACCPNCHTQKHCHCCMDVSVNFTNIQTCSFWQGSGPGSRPHLLEKHWHGCAWSAKKTMADVAVIYKTKLSLNNLPIKQIVFISSCPIHIKQIHSWPWLESLLLRNVSPATFATIILLWPPTPCNIVSPCRQLENYDRPNPC